MTEESWDAENHSYWFVNATYEARDEASRFISEGVWELDPDASNPRYRDLVLQMRPGDRIAIKTNFNRARDLPFDNRGRKVSGMAIRAIGAIKENPGDGRSVRVSWTPVSPPREWYFYTHTRTIWRVGTKKPLERELLAFTFENRSQDIDHFRNRPYWRDRFGDQKTDTFAWSEFFQAFATRLLDFKDKRSVLLDGIRKIWETDPIPSLRIYLNDKYENNTNGPLKDICPFTLMGAFNRKITDANRQRIAAEVARILDLEIAPPASFKGVPVLNNQNSWFFSYAYMRQDNDIDKLWRVFCAAAALVESDTNEARDEFAEAYDEATAVRGVGWKLSLGLYWAHPWEFPTLDGPSRKYLADRLQMSIPTRRANLPCSGADYLNIRDTLKERFEDDGFPVHSFPELSLEARRAYPGQDDLLDTNESSFLTTGHSVTFADAAAPYAIDNIVADGCFLERRKVEEILERLRTRKNLILQGPPGTGKTWLARRLGYALMGKKDPSKIKAVQFHPNLSYEDFVRGYRPMANGQLALVEGVFMEVVHQALENPDASFVVIIEEINRGNPAHIFGELLTLLEASKRSSNDALELSYPDPSGKRTPVYVPENVYVIGTMNIADRSLALVDYAFRRRFAFVELEPQLGPAWVRWVTDKCGLNASDVAEIERRMTRLNETIANYLGRQYRIGHSFVTPAEAIEPEKTRDWFGQVVETEIGPLLEEYWFDAPQKAKEVIEELKQGW